MHIIIIAPRNYQIKKVHRLLEKATLAANISVIIFERSGFGKLDLSLPPMGHPISLIISVTLEVIIIPFSHLLLTCLFKKHAIQSGDCNCVCIYRHTYKKCKTDTQIYIDR